MTASGLSAGQLADIRARAEAATKGPWLNVMGEISGPMGFLIADALNASHDAAHIAGMDPTTTLALLALVERLQGDVARVRELHVHDHGTCLMCVDEFDNPAFWPCPTIAALDGPAAGGEL